MAFLKTLAYIIIGIYLLAILLLFILQTRLLFYPGKLSRSFPFKLNDHGEEVWIKTDDGESINGLFFRGNSDHVILYFHGNAGDLSGWQFVGEDFTSQGFNILIIDYRGYGKSSGSISENGLYEDGRAAYQFLLQEKEFLPENIIIYGRSIGTGVAVNVASKSKIAGVVLEAPYTSIPDLANEKFPYFFAGLISRYRFNNLQKINSIQCPIIFIHGDTDTLIPSHHSAALYRKFTGRKQLITIKGGSHNDLIDFEEYQHFLSRDMLTFFFGQ